jgi:hypothetical protein
MLKMVIVLNYGLAGGIMEFKHTKTYPCPKCIAEGKETDFKVIKYNLEIDKILKEILLADKWIWEDYQIEYLRGN